MSLESFKEFVKKRPNLINYVETKEKTWQEFYNLYTLYGENSNIWDKYNNTYITKPTTLKDVFNIFKDVDMSKFQESITSLQKGINYIGDIVKTKEGENIQKPSYEARPMYKYFDD